MDLTTLPVLELLLRGTAIYFLVATVFRIAPKRHMGGNSPNDILALVILGGLVADAMSTGSEGPGDFLILAGVIVFWEWALNYLEMRSRLVSRFTQERPTVIVVDGRRRLREMRRELITEAELQACLRRSGIERLEDVARATVESTGEISFVRKDPDGPPDDSAAVADPKRPM